MAPNIDWSAVDGLAKGSTLDDDVIDKVIEDIRPIQESDFKNDPDKMFKLFKSVLNAYDVSFFTKYQFSYLFRYIPHFSHFVTIHSFPYDKNN